MLLQFADAWARGKPTAINVRFGNRAPANVLELQDLCTRHNIIDLYLWLSNRFPGNFVERELALRQKDHAISLIQQGLKNLDLNTDEIERLGFGGNRSRGRGGSGGGGSGSSTDKKLTKGERRDETKKRKAAATKSSGGKSGASRGGKGAVGGAAADRRKVRGSTSRGGLKKKTPAAAAKGKAKGKKAKA